ncbi:hypothetical protein KTH93_08800 [Acinetobacter bereziniae]|uniref:hypothetical protein n=1 Tax=Acinetobacter bereziniae TaxID=106648 RepID=UPI0021CE4876|nr:hypothetical protein [Acinetobacter bereziniae]MCU4435580.1 hypothetical protein [Acinetobacter bereziniae]
MLIINLKKLIKLIFYFVIILILTVTFVVVVEKLIILISYFFIGLKESFLNASNLVKLYLLGLYLIIFYLLINLKLASIEILKLYNMLNGKYFKSKSKEDVDKFKMIVVMFFIYAAISLLGLAIYKAFGNSLNNSNKGDLINIFIWATYILTPIVAIWVLSGWKSEFRDREKYIFFDNLEVLVVEFEESLSVFYENIKVSWDMEVYNKSMSLCIHSIFKNDDDYIKLYFGELYNKINENIELNINVIDIMLSRRSEVLKLHNNFKLNRTKNEFYKSDLMYFDDYSLKLEELVQKLNTAATLISSNVIDEKSRGISKFRPDLWIAQFNSTKDSCIVIDLKEFKELSSKILKNIENSKLRILE